MDMEMDISSSDEKSTDAATTYPDVNPVTSKAVAPTIHGRHAQRSFRPENPGSWSCSACAFDNIPCRVDCYRCHTPKPGWSCAACSYENLPIRVDCYKCHIPKARSFNSLGSRTGPGVVVQPGDWACTRCENVNFASKTQCVLRSLPNPNPIMTQEPDVQTKTPPPPLLWVPPSPPPPPPIAPTITKNVRDCAPKSPASSPISTTSSVTPSPKKHVAPTPSHESVNTWRNGLVEGYGGGELATSPKGCG